MNRRHKEENNNTDSSKQLATTAFCTKTDISLSL